MEQKLLDLTLEYSAAKDAESWGAVFPGKATRTLDDIAAEYGQILKQFLAD